MPVENLYTAHIVSTHILDARRSAARERAARHAAMLVHPRPGPEQTLFMNRLHRILRRAA